MRHALLVEDDRDVLQLWTMELGQLGFVVHTADRMDRAIELFQAHPMTVVITDFHIQHGSGRRLLNEIRKTHPALPVFLMTGTPYVKEEDFSQLDFSGVFLKPFSRQSLIDAILAACP